MRMDSIWTVTAGAAPDTSSLADSAAADVAVVGAGYTGIAAALRLAQGGARVVVLDAGTPGMGASGRNGGQVIPGLKYDPDDLAAMYGEESVDFVGGAADLVFDLIATHKIDCDPVRGGWIQPSMKHAHLKALHSRAAQWVKRGAPAEGLDRSETARLTGSQAFVGGWIDRRAGRLHPLNYMRGLLRVALAAGARVYGNTRVTGLRREGNRWLLSTAVGAPVTADEVVIGTNGYTDDLWPDLKRTVIPANSFQIATAPLNADALRSLLPEGSVVSDSRRVANYFRIGPGGRLLMGGRGTFAEPRSAADYAFLTRAVVEIFPDLAGIPVEYGWAGRIALTRDFLPHIHQPVPNLTIALGYNGRGVALATAMGNAIGAHLLDRSALLPLKLTRINPLPLHDLHRQYATAMIYYYRLRDMLER